MSNKGRVATNCSCPIVHRQSAYPAKKRLKEYGEAIFIGEETGTCYEGFAAGSKQYVTLKNAQFRIGIPRYHITFDQSKKQITSNRGLLPDYEIEPIIQDLLEEKDLYMAKAMELTHKMEN